MSEMQLVWGWEPALYLFLGGLGAGIFAAASVLHLATKGGKRKMLAAASWSAVVCLAIGLLLLIIELEAPLRGLMLWQSFSHFTSWMTFGAWVVFAALIVFGVTALLSTEMSYGLIGRKWKTLPEKRDKIVRMLCFVGLLLGLGVAVYTGLLLMSAPGVPLWNTWLLPCLFTVSALDTGVAAVVIILAVTKEATHEISRKMETGVIALVALEILVLIVFASVMLEGGHGAGLAADATAQAQAGAYSISVTSVASISMLLSGDLAVWFWVVFVGFGLLVPLLAALYAFLPNAAHARKIGLLGAGGALIGGCALRFLVLLAGQHADFVGNAVASLFM